MKDSYFGEWWDIHNGRLCRAGTIRPGHPETYFAGGRAIYGDWGRFGNIAVDPKSNILNQNNAKLPFVYKGLPLFCIKKNETLWDQEQNYNPHLFISKRADDLLKYNYIKQNIEKAALDIKKRHKPQMVKFIDLVKSNKVTLETLRKNSRFLPKLFYYLIHEHPELLSGENAEILNKLSSPMYSGGCIKLVNFHNHIYFVYCDGYRLSRLSIKRFDPISNKMENTAINEWVISETDDDPIFQIDVTGFEGFYYILVRFEHRIDLLKLLEEESDLKIQKLSSADSRSTFISCKLDPNWHGRAISTHPDQIRLMDSEALSNVWCKAICCYSSVIDQWNEVQSTNMPNTWLVTNRCSSSHYDCRIDPFKAGTEVYSNRGKSLSANESFYHGSNMFQGHYFYLFSTFNAILVDRRSPMVAVNQWTVPLMSPASYSAIDLLPTCSTVNVTVGCQLDAKHMMFQQHDETHSKSTALCSRPGLFTNSPMALGLASHVHEASQLVTIMTLDHNANVFGQQYQLNADENDQLSWQLPTTYGTRCSKRFLEQVAFIQPCREFKLGQQYLCKGDRRDGIDYGGDCDLIARWVCEPHGNQQKMETN